MRRIRQDPERAGRIMLCKPCFVTFWCLTLTSIVLKAILNIVNSSVVPVLRQGGADPFQAGQMPG
jgi:hypothetical protein